LQDGHLHLAGTDAGSLTTTSAGGNDHNGAMFDLTATVDIEITGFDYLCVDSTETNVEVYYVTDHTSFVGKNGNSSLWTLLLRTHRRTQPSPT
jgi:hypothetical protein